MDKKLFSLLASAVIFCFSCSSTTEEDNNGENDSTVVVEDLGTDGGSTRTVRTELSESDAYVDLRTGKPIKIRRTESGMYAGDVGDLGLYVNTSTGDTFYGGEAYRVNGHVIHEGDNWDVDQAWLGTQGNDIGMVNDPEKINTQDDGDYKAKYKEGDIKEKIKVDGDGKDIKYKYKNDEADIKVKMTEDQMKVKDPSGKTEIESDGSTKTKPNR